MTLFAGQSAFCNELTVLTEDLPPLNYIDNGVLVGPSVEIVREIIKRLGTKEQIQVYPWARAYKMALEEKNIVLFGMTYTEVSTILRRILKPAGDPESIVKLSECVSARYTEQQVRRFFLLKIGGI